MPVWKKYISKSSLSGWILSSVLYLVLGVPFFINTQLHSFCLSTRAKKKILQKVNLTKYYNVIVVCVQMCTYLSGECLRLTVHCTLVTGPGLASGSGSPGPVSPAPRAASHGLTTRVPSSLARPFKEKRSTTLLLFQLLCYCCCCCCSFCYHYQSPTNVK